ncbi:MAG: magnesium transporter CorA family protein [Bacteroidaceae bacterium]|nr:magnesium transporter CorA family protein [Bacteroidaceae bacterium]
MRTFWNYNHTLRLLDEWKSGCWTQITCPTQDDEDYLTQELNIPAYFLDDIRDKDERARFDYDEGWQLIILRIPYVREVKSRTPHTTIPLGIIMKDDVCVTVCNYETNMMIDFVAYQQKRGLGFTDSVDFVFRLFLSSAVWYLKRLKQISALIEEAKQNLEDRVIDNEDLIALSRLQDSLTYFVTSIRGNETLLSKLKFKLPVDELDADLIEDVNIEIHQARETANIYSHILDSTMETYASVINNNMSGVMKQMTSVSIILMFPTLIASIFGMNLINGMENHLWGMPIVVIGSVIVTGAFYWVFRRRAWL